VIEERRDTISAILTSHLPIQDRHRYTDDPTIADAISDRPIHNAHRITLEEDPTRKK
jgi:DNA replication protein DnaC